MFISLTDPKLNPMFDRVTITVILGNCVSLALYDPFDTDCKTDLCQILLIADLIFSVYFTLECIAKIMAMGFIGEKTYLSNSWNQMDFIVVVFGLIDFLPGFESGALSMIRVTRVLRPLRAINQLPSLRILINLIFATLPQLGNVVLLCLFLFVVFAILCMNLFMGLLRNRCYAGNTTEMYCGAENCEDPWICSLPIDTGMARCYPGQQQPHAASCCSLRASRSAL